MDEPQKLTEQVTAGYRPPAPYWSTLMELQRLPVFNYMQAEAMELTPQVIFGLAIGNSPLYQSKVEIECDDAEAAEYLNTQWHKMWSTSAKTLLSHKRSGFMGCEVVYEWNEEKKELGIDRIVDFHPLDVKALTESGKINGIRIRNNKLKREVTLTGPKYVWLKYDAGYGNIYGRSLHRGAYEPWWERQKPTGATDLRRLKYLKDAWVGDQIRFPLRNEKVPNASGGYDLVSAKDLAEQGCALRASGGVTALPSTRSDGTNLDYEYVPPQNIGGGAEILAYIENLDWEIWKGLLVPREVVEAATSGSGFSGRSVPMIAFLGMRDVELMDIVSTFKPIFKFLLQFKYGKKIDFTMKPKPLADQFAEQVGGTQAGGPLGQNPNQPGQQQGAFPEIAGNDAEEDQDSGFRFSVEDEHGHLHSEKDGKFVAKEHTGESLQVDHHLGNKAVPGEATAKALVDIGLPAKADDSGATVALGQKAVASAFAKKGWIHESFQYKNGVRIDAFQKGGFRATVSEDSAKKTGVFITAGHAPKINHGTGQFAVGESHSVEEQAAAVANVLGADVKRQIHAALKKKSVS